MKIFIGILSAVIILTGATLTVLALWDIQPISLSIILRSGATIAIVCVTCFALWLIRVLFFKKDLFNSNKGK
jgi:hypothetical protein